MNYLEIRGFLEKNHRDKFKFERWITEQELEIISNVVKGYPVLYESGTANGLSAYGFSKVVDEVHTFDPYSRPKIWDFIDLDHSKIKYHEISFHKVPIMNVQPKAFFIDGDHSYQGVKMDWDAIYPELVPSDVVVFHDAFGTSGVRRILSEIEPLTKQKVLSDNPRRGIVEVRI